MQKVILTGWSELSLAIKGTQISVLYVPSVATITFYQVVYGPGSRQTNRRFGNSLPYAPANALTPEYPTSSKIMTLVRRTLAA
jgi:hypothetical protein